MEIPLMGGAHLFYGMPITYDSIGNPLTDGVWEYIWQHGRQLSCMYGEDVGGDANDITIEYTYDANGMRIGKIVTKRNYLTHQHSYTETVVPPTCTEGGYTLHECACGDTYQDSATPALGHSYTDTVTAPTCTEAGYTTHTCSACGYSYQSDETAALGHSYTDTVTAPTCTETGYTTHTCSVCGYSYQSDETAALGHSYTAVVTAPTCTETGYTTHTCTACGDSYQDTYVDALGHSYTSTVVAPTCTERGYTRHVCSACGDSYQDTYVAALGHNYFLVKDPLWGQEIYRCIRCGHIKVEDEIPIIPVDPPVEEMSYSLSSGSEESERILDSTVVQEYAYVYNGSALMQMVVQTTVDDGTPTTETLYFSYDASGIPMSLVYNGTDYFYTVNLQGDVMLILDTDGEIVVEYTYDAWGNILTVTGSMADTLGALNPLTYRGYVYDTETGLYYLQSRYYNPEIGRFINADAFTTTGQGLLSNNMFAYCLNNPINMLDDAGNWPKLSTIFTAVATAALAVAAVAAVVTVAALAAPAFVAVGGTVLSTTAVASAAITIGTQAVAVAAVSTVASVASSKEEKKYSQTYSVYFLEDQNGTIQYVGRVTDSGYNARMAYHYYTRGLTPAKRISGLSYDEARGLEEIGMIECHTLNALNPTNNQIHGISPYNTNGERYMEAACDYLFNRAENWVLNLIS